MKQTTASKRRRTAALSSGRRRLRGGRPAGLFTWVAVGLVTVVVAVLAIHKVTSGPANTATMVTPFQPTSPAIVHELEHVPLRVFNTVGVNSPVAVVTPPQALRDQPSLVAMVGGKKLPEILYVGGEFCPFCAAQRWAMIIALSRFGTFSGLGNMSSYSGDAYPNTATFTFVDATYTSSYVAFTPVEEYANYLNKAKTNYATLERLTHGESAEIKKYDTSQYIKGLSADSDYPIPFMSFGNRFLVSGSSYGPATLQGMTRSQIAAGLSIQSDPITQAIIASANYQTAAICSLTDGAPNDVCASPGVTKAATTMGLK